MEKEGFRFIVLALLVQRQSEATEPGRHFHDEVGSAELGGAGIEHLRDVGVIHHGQCLALLLEARDHIAGVHAELDDLEGDPAAHRLFLLSVRMVA